MVVAVISFVVVCLLSCGCVGLFSWQDSHSDRDHDRLLAYGSDEFGEHAETAEDGILVAKGWKEFPVKIYLSSEISGVHRTIVLQSIAAWEMATGKKLITIQGVLRTKKDTFGDRDRQLKDGRNVLAFTDLLAGRRHLAHGAFERQGAALISVEGYKVSQGGFSQMYGPWVMAGDIYLNGAFFRHIHSRDLSQAERRDYYKILRAVVIHELGHFLGLGHMNSSEDSRSIMQAEMNHSSDIVVLSRGDVIRIQKIYGCAGAACHIHRVMRQLERLQSMGLR
ncbi:MAG: matrixin family metalloprotease [Proteobacteria bacterium]|nr:matrixin family metalloprotease [Pseudomonadota bacterium]